MQAIQTNNIVLSSFQFCLCFFLDLFLDDYFLLAVKLFIEKMHYKHVRVLSILLVRMTRSVRGPTRSRILQHASRFFLPFTHANRVYICRWQDVAGRHDRAKSAKLMDSCISISHQRFIIHWSRSISAIKSRPLVED